MDNIQRCIEGRNKAYAEFELATVYNHAFPQHAIAAMLTKGLDTSIDELVRTLEDMEGSNIVAHRCIQTVKEEWLEYQWQLYSHPDVYARYFRGAEHGLSALDRGAASALSKSIFANATLGNMFSNDLWALTKNGVTRPHFMQDIATALCIKAPLSKHQSEPNMKQPPLAVDVVRIVTERIQLLTRDELHKAQLQGQLNDATKRLLAQGQLLKSECRDYELSLKTESCTQLVDALRAEYEGRLRVMIDLFEQRLDPNKTTSYAQMLQPSRKRTRQLPEVDRDELQTVQCDWILDKFRQNQFANFKRALEAIQSRVAQLRNTATELLQDPQRKADAVWLETALDELREHIAADVAKVDSLPLKHDAFDRYIEMLCQHDTQLLFAESIKRRTKHLLACTPSDDDMIRLENIKCRAQEIETMQRIKPGKDFERFVKSIEVLFDEMDLHRSSQSKLADFEHYMKESIDKKILHTIEEFNRARKEDLVLPLEPLFEGEDWTCAEHYDLLSPCTTTGSMYRLLSPSGIVPFRPTLLSLSGWKKRASVVRKMVPSTLPPPPKTTMDALLAMVKPALTDANQRKLRELKKWILAPQSLRKQHRWLRFCQTPNSHDILLLLLQ